MGGVRWLLAAALAALGLAACAVTDRPEPPAVAATTTTAGPDGIRDRTLSWEAGRLDADPRRLVVSFTGADPAADPADPCWEGYAPEVSAEPDRVVVRVRVYRSRTPLGPQQFCTDMGFVRTLAVPLHGPLAGRAVLDGRGRRHRLAPVPLEPRWLPGGWRLVQESGQATPGGHDAWERSYGPGPEVGGTAGGVGVSQVTVTDRTLAVGQAGQGRPGAGWWPARPSGEVPPPSSAPMPTRPWPSAGARGGGAWPSMPPSRPPRPSGTRPPSRTCSSGSPRASGRRVRGAVARRSRPGCR